MYLNKLNSGSRAWVEKDKSYSLYFLNKIGEWQLVNTIVCQKDSSIVFKDVPKNTLYLLKKNEEKKRLERIFIYKNRKQIFY